MSILQRIILYISPKQYILIFNLRLFEDLYNLIDSFSRVRIEEYRLIKDLMSLLEQVKESDHQNHSETFISYVSHLERRYELSLDLQPKVTDLRKKARLRVVRHIKLTTLFIMLSFCYTGISVYVITIVSRPSGIDWLLYALIIWLTYYVITEAVYKFNMFLDFDSDAEETDKIDLYGINKLNARFVSTELILLFAATFNAILWVLDSGNAIYEPRVILLSGVATISYVFRSRVKDTIKPVISKTLAETLKLFDDYSELEETSNELKQYNSTILDELTGQLLQYKEQLRDPQIFDVDSFKSQIAELEELSEIQKEQHENLVIVVERFNTLKAQIEFSNTQS